MDDIEQPMGEAAPAAKKKRHRFIPTDGSYPFHPFLFAAASVLAVMARNLDHAGLADVLPSLVGVLLFALAVYLLVALLRRRLDRLTTIISSIWVVGLLFYGQLFKDVNGIVQGSFSMAKTLPYAFAILVAVTALAILLRRASGLVHSVLTGIAAVLLITPIWNTVSYEWRNGAAREIYNLDRAMAEIDPFIAPAGERISSKRPPDIYHFIFDRYASEPILQQHFGIDNSAIGRFLEQRGFYVARDSNSNYQKTGHSLASTLYMDYLNLLGDDPRAKGSNWRPIYEMLDETRASKFLISQGYDFLQFGSWWVGTYDNPLAKENHPHGFSEFEMIYLRTTAALPVSHILPRRPLTMRLDWDNAQCQRVGPQVEEIKAIGERDKPVYVFAHFLVTHGPFVFTPEGRCLTLQEQIKRGEDQGYVDGIAYANKIIEEIVTTLQSPDREPPIIIIQADEGPFPERDWSIPWQDSPVDDLRIKTGILNAYFFPNKDYGSLRSDITPVNSYRVVFNNYLGANFPILPDRIFFFPNDANIYEFHDVTEKIRRPANVAGRAIDQPLQPVN